MKIIYLDPNRSHPLSVSDSAYTRIKVALANIVCQECGTPLTQDWPMVVLNTCLSCFMQSEPVKRLNKLAYMGEFGKSFDGRDTQFMFIDAEGYVYITLSGMEHPSLTRHIIYTLIYWGFTPPERIPLDNSEYRLDWNCWSIYGDFTKSDVLILRYKEDFGHHLDMLFFSYKGDGCVEINKRKKEVQRMFKEARARIEAIKDEEGWYHEGRKIYRLEDEYLYPMVAQIANSEYEKGGKTIQS